MNYTTLSFSSCCHLFAVNKEGLAAAMKEMNDTMDLRANNYSPPIHNATDNDIQKSIKDILKPMLRFYPADRPSMAEVVTRLSDLHASCAAKTTATGAAAKATATVPDDTYTERILLVAGDSGDVAFLDQQAHDPLLTHIPLCAYAPSVSVCAAPDGFM